MPFFYLNVALFYKKRNKNHFFCGEIKQKGIKNTFRIYLKLKFNNFDIIAWLLKQKWHWDQKMVTKRCFQSTMQIKKVPEETFEMKKIFTIKI